MNYYELVDADADSDLLKLKMQRTGGVGRDVKDMVTETETQVPCIPVLHSQRIPSVTVIHYRM